MKEKLLETMLQEYEKLKSNKAIIQEIDKDFFFNFVDTLIARYKQLEKEKVEEFAMGYTKCKLDFKKKYIPKSKVKEKIEEYREKAREYVKQKEYNQADIKMFYIYALQELLGEE